MTSPSDKRWPLILFVQEAWRLAVQRRREAVARKRRYAVALAFNDLYTHTSRDGRWMCPSCNQVHKALPDLSFWTGLQYPACCEFPDGHRLYEQPYATTCNVRPA